MTVTDATGVQRTAAEAAMVVPGVVELPPDLRQSLAGAATHVLRALGSAAALPEAGIHTECVLRTGTWHIEARCAVHDDRRVADTARDVHDAIQAAVGAHLVRRGTPGPVTVVVTVTRIDGQRRSPLRGTA